MTIIIPEFWAGVTAVLLAEFGVFVVFVIKNAIKQKKQSNVTKNK